MNETSAPARFYVIVRADLPCGPQMAQAVHSAIQFCHEWPEFAEPWYRESNYLVVVSVENEDELKDLADQILTIGEIRYSITTEPDLDDSWTAIALQPGETARLVCAHLPLALKHAEEPILEDFY